MVANYVRNFHLPWQQYDNYWIVLRPVAGGYSDNVAKLLKELGCKESRDDTMAFKAGKQWKKAWDVLYHKLLELGGLSEIKVAVVPGDALPSEIADYKKPEKIQGIAESLWLGEALMQDRVVCYLQPVVSAKEKTFGFESFARVKSEDGSVIGGGKIVAASREMNIEFMIDRLLQVQAIHTFAASNFNGFLFVNFFSGFIHRPAVYLEGLSETVKHYGILAKHIVLDFTRSESQHDMKHLMNVCDYCRSKGYSIALDDIGSFDGAKKLITEIRPDFVKIDMDLAHQVADRHKRLLIKDIVELAHKTGGTVIGEGVETEDMHQQLAALGVDLFQGYHFSPPVPVEQVLGKKATG